MGSGAMGTVVRAYDPQLDRSVAIKVLRTQANERDPRARARFDREAKTLAKLNHPNVVSVHEVGEAHGQMFVAMEMVDGADLAAWLTQRPDATSRFSETLELLFQAGRGLSAAHRAGVVHRDFKPANVLVGNDGRVRVADFGLARIGVSPDLLESREAEPEASASVTQTGAVLGTPAYMAPEQRDGQAADALADQYAFCVTAWEALFGARPEPEADMAVPAGATSQMRSVAAALKRGLNSERTARFADMATLVDTLARNPVQRRRRLAVGALALVGAGAMFAAYGLERASRCDDVVAPADDVWDDARRQTLARGFLAVDWAGAEQSWQRFSRDADAYVRDWKTAAVASCRAARVDRTLDSQIYEAQSACFEDRLARFAGVLDVYSETTRDLVVSPFSLARALGPLEVCVDRPQTVALDSRPLMKKLGRALGVLRAGQPAKAAETFQQVLKEAQAQELPLVEMQALAAIGKTQRQLEGPEHSTATLSKAYWMALEHGDDALAAQVASSLAFGLASTGELEEAERWLKPATVLSSRARLSGDERSELEGARARVAFARGDFDTAQVHFTESHRLAVATWGPEHPQTVASEQHLARVLIRQGELDRAIELIEHSLRVRLEHFGPWHPDVAHVHSSLGIAQGMHQRPAEAAKHFERAADIFTETYGREHRDVASSLTSLGQANQALGDEAAAERFYAEAVEIFAKVVSPDDTLALTARMNLGRSRVSNGRCAEALPLLTTVQSALARRSEQDPRVGIARWMLGACQVRLGLLDAAAEPLHAALAAFEGHPNEEAGVLIELARMHRAAGAVQQGREAVGRALTLLDEETSDPLTRAKALTVKAWLALDQSDLANALQHARASVVLVRDAPVSPALRAEEWGEAARVLVAVGAPAEAKATALEAHALIDEPDVANQLVPALTADLYLALAEAEIAGDAEASKQWAQRALSALQNTDASYDDDRTLARELADLP